MAKYKNVMKFMSMIRGIPMENLFLDSLCLKTTIPIILPTPPPIKPINISWISGILQLFFLALNLSKAYIKKAVILIESIYIKKYLSI